MLANLEKWHGNVGLIHSLAKTYICMYGKHRYIQLHHPLNEN